MNFNLKTGAQGRAWVAGPSVQHRYTLGACIVALRLDAAAASSHTAGVVHFTVAPRVLSGGHFEKWHKPLRHGFSLLFVWNRHLARATIRVDRCESIAGQDPQSPRASFMDRDAVVAAALELRHEFFCIRLTAEKGPSPLSPSPSPPARPPPAHSQRTSRNAGLSVYTSRDTPAGTEERVLKSDPAAIPPALSRWARTPGVSFVSRWARTPGTS